MPVYLPEEVKFSCKLLGRSSSTYPIGVITRLFLSLVAPIAPVVPNVNDVTITESIAVIHLWPVEQRNGPVRWFLALCYRDGLSGFPLNGVDCHLDVALIIGALSSRGKRCKSWWDSIIFKYVFFHKMSSLEMYMSIVYSLFNGYVMFKSSLVQRGITNFTFMR